MERVSPLVVDNVADPIEASDCIPVFHLGAPAIPQSLAGRLPYRPNPVVQSDDSVEGLKEREIEPQVALGKAIRALRGERDLTQEALAHGAGITVGHLSKIERGLTNPTWGTVSAIATALGVSMVEVAKVAEKDQNYSVTSLRSEA